MVEIDAHQEVEEIIHQVDAFVNILPSPLKSLGERFAITGYPYRTAFLNNDLAFPGLHLPFWLAQRYEPLVHDPDLFLAQVQKIVRAALFGYLYIRIQDDVYDHKETHDPAMLLLANEFIRECFQIYHQLFAPHSAFWRCFQTAWLDFSEATAWEIEHCRGKIRSLADGELSFAGRKLSFAKVPVVAVLLVSNQEQDIPFFLRMVDLLAISSQLLNDFFSIERDLATHHFTSLLSDALEMLDTQSERSLQNVIFERFLQKHSVEALFDRVISLDREVLNMLGDLEMEPLRAFLEKRLSSVKEMKEKYLKIKLEVLFSAG